MRNLLIVLASVSIAVNIFTAVELMKHLEQCNMKSISSSLLSFEIKEITDQKELSENAILKWLEKEKASDQ